MNTIRLEIIIDVATFMLLQEYAATLVRDVDDGSVPGIDEIQADPESLCGALIMTQLQQWLAEQQPREAVAA
jgi:hypothetical protein